MQFVYKFGISSSIKALIKQNYEAGREDAKNICILQGLKVTTLETTITLPTRLSISTVYATQWILARMRLTWLDWNRRQYNKLRIYVVSLIGCYVTY